MSGAVSFTTIPPNLRVPLMAVEFDSSQAGGTQPNQVALLIGGTLNAQPLAPVLGVSVAMSRAMFGRGSQLARMHEAYLDNDNFGQVRLLPIPDPATGTDATITQTIAGTATAAGTLSTYVGGQLVAIPVNVGDTGASLAALLANSAAGFLDIPALPTYAGAVITWIAKHKGVSGNSIDIRMNYQGLAAGEAIPAGITVAIADTNNGTGTPDLTGIAAVLGDAPYDFIACAYTDPASLTSLKAMMNNTAGRWSPLRLVYGHVVTAMVATQTALATFGATVNDPHLTVFGVYNTPTPPWEIAAAVLGTMAPALKADPARPVQTLGVSAVLAPPPVSRFNKAAQQSMLLVGIAQLAFDASGNVSIVRAITTYQFNSLGQADQSLFDSETLYTLMAITRQLSGAISTKFPRSKVADDGTAFAPGQPVVTPKILLAEIAAQYQIMQLNGLVEDATAMITATQVVRNDLDPGRLDVLWVPYLLQGLRVVAIKNQFHLFSALLAS